jgi:hypothetical protein
MTVWCKQHHNHTPYAAGLNSSDEEDEIISNVVQIHDSDNLLQGTYDTMKVIPKPLTHNTQYLHPTSPTSQTQHPVIRPHNQLRYPSHNYTCPQLNQYQTYTLVYILLLALNHLKFILPGAHHHLYLSSPCHHPRLQPVLPRLTSHQLVHMALISPTTHQLVHLFLPTDNRLNLMFTIFYYIVYLSPSVYEVQTHLINIFEHNDWTCLWVSYTYQEYLILINIGPINISTYGI